MFPTFASLHDFQDVAFTQPDPDSDLDEVVGSQYHLQKSHASPLMTVRKFLRDNIIFSLFIRLAQSLSNSLLY
jgi:hypothetical protein